jgi:predicted PurR-regulated permease PerM
VASLVRVRFIDNLGSGVRRLDLPSHPLSTFNGMRADQIEVRAIAKLVLWALFYVALGLLLVVIILHTRTTLQWVAAAVFLALALDPAVGLLERIRIGERSLPRVAAVGAVYLVFFAGLAFLILHVLPPLVKDVEELAKKLPTYVSDLEQWAEDNEQFQELNEKYGITQKLSEQASSLPGHLSSGASVLGSFTVSLLEHLLAAITVLTLTFFLLLDGKGMFQRGTERLPRAHRDRARRVGARVAQVVRAYVSVNLLLAIAAGVLTWLFLELGGFHLAIPMGVLVAFLDLIPLIGLTVGGFSVFGVLLIDGGVGDAFIWLALFLVYQQLQDRVIQPVLYKGGALKVNPVVAIIAVIVGANLAGVLGALLAIPTVASLGVVIDEYVFSGPPRAARAKTAD